MIFEFFVILIIGLSLSNGFPGKNYLIWYSLSNNKKIYFFEFDMDAMLVLNKF